MDYMQFVSPDIAQEILYKLDPYELNEACKLNKYFQNRVCTTNFRNLYAKKNKKTVQVFIYDGPKLKIKNVGNQWYDIIGIDDNNIVLVDLKGFIWYYDSFKDEKEKSLHRDIKKVIDASDDLVINHRNEVILLEDSLILDTDVKNLIPLSWDSYLVDGDDGSLKQRFRVKESIVLYINGDVYYTKRNFSGEIEDRKLLKTGIQQLIENNRKNIMLDRNGNVFMIDYKSDDAPVYPTVAKLKLEQEIEYIQPNQYSKKIFLRDSNQNGWLLDLQKLTVIDLERKLKQGIFINNNFIGLQFDGTVITHFNFPKGGARRRMKLKNNEQVLEIVALGDGYAIISKEIPKSTRI